MTHNIQSRHWDILTLAIAMLLAVAVRVVAVRLLPPTTVSWQYEYVELGENLAQRGQYLFSFYGMHDPEPSSFLPPVYPLLLAAVAKGFGATDDSAKIVTQSLQVLLFLAALLAMVGITTELGFNRWAQRACWLFFALYPPLVAYSVDISTALLETVFLQGALWLVLRLARVPHWGLAWAAGWAMALAMLTRPTWLVVLPCAVLWLLWQYRHTWRTALLMATVVCASFAILCAPWVWHNYRSHGKIQLTSTNGGLNLWIGNHPNGNGEYIFPSELDRVYVNAVAQLPEAARDQAFYRTAMAFIRENPRRFVVLVLLKSYYYIFFRPGIGSSYQHLQTDISLVSQVFITSWLVLLPLAAIGIWQQRRQFGKYALPLSFFAAQGVLSAIYFTGTRFRTPIDSAVMLLAFVGLAAVLARARRLWHARRTLFARPLPALLLLTASFGMLYANSVHPWQAPDEYLHYEYLQMVAQHPEKGLGLTLRWTDRDSAMQWAVAESFIPFQHARFRGYPTLPQAEFRATELPLGSTNFTPIMPLFYFMALPLTRLMAGLPVLLQLYLWRVLMVGLHLGVVWLGYRLMRLLGVNQWLCCLVGLFLALQPQYTFASASFNNDNLLPLWVAAALVAGFAGLRADNGGRVRASLPHYVAFMLFGVLALLTKRTAVGVLGMAAAGSLSYASAWLWQPQWWRKALGGLVWLLTLAGGTALIWLIWQQPTLSAEQAVALRLPPNAIPNFFAKLATLSQSQTDWQHAARLFFQSFWGYFGWFTIPMGDVWYALTGLLSGLAVIGCGVALVRYRKHWAAWHLCFWVLSGVLVMALAMAAQYLIAPESYIPQGRYTFPFLVPLAIAFAVGWLAILPRRWQPTGFWVYAVLLLGLNISALWQIVRVFYG